MTILEMFRTATPEQIADMFCCKCNEYSGNCDECPSFLFERCIGEKNGFVEWLNEEEGAVLKGLVDRMPTITLEQFWVPYKEKHPDKTDWYLVTLDDGSHAPRWYSLSYGWERIAGNDVIAWLPNPEPYRGNK